MKKYFLIYGLCFLLSGCNDKQSSDVILFSTSIDYPPFEYKIKGDFVGFDIELAEMIAKELGKKAEFQDTDFSTIFTAVQNNMVDAAISTITITPEREQNFDFSRPYYVESLAILFPRDHPITEQSELLGKKIACQLGTTMEIWMKRHAKETEVITVNNNMQAIEALKAGYVDGVLVDQAQAAAFSNKNPQLSYKVIAKADTGYSIAFKKGSPLKDAVNNALESLEAKGIIEGLKKKYLELK